MITWSRLRKKTIRYQFKLNKDKTYFKGETTLAFLKQVFDPRHEKSFDWAFATNQSSINLDYIVATYKRRWRIKTGFRVQDEAQIKSKSIDTRIRFLFFVYKQMLQLLWVMLHKEDVSFKSSSWICMISVKSGIVNRSDQFLMAISVSQSYGDVGL